MLMVIIILEEEYINKEILYMNNQYAISFNENIHYPASYYFCSGYIPELAQKILEIINDCEKNSIYIESVNMNKNTYSWLFRLFNSPLESFTNPLSSTVDNKYIYDYLINIVSNSELTDGTIIFNIGD